MRTLRLARLAAEAEGLRLRKRAQRMAMRLVLALIGLGFLSGAVVFAHVAIWFALRERLFWSAPGAALALAGGDLLIALCLVFAASRSSPSRVELEALQVRQSAIEGARRDLTLATLLTPTLSLLGGLLRRRR